MRLVVYLPLVVPLLTAVAARPLAERLPPAAATWLLSVSALLLAAAAASEARALRRRAAALLAADRQARLLPGTGQVVVTDDDAADAYTLPGLPCRILVTAGMLRALNRSEQQVLLAHERAHAAGLHYLFGTAARLAAAANPLLHPVTAAVGYTMERWADEHAAAVAGDRQLAARAIARAAMATTAGPAPPRPGSRRPRRRHPPDAVPATRAGAPPSRRPAPPPAAAQPAAPRRCRPARRRIRGLGPGSGPQPVLTSRPRP